MLWDRIPSRRGILDATLCDKVCQWLATGRWFSPDIPVSSTNKTDRHDNNWNIVESGVKHYKTIFSTYIYLPAAKVDINAPKLNNLFLYREQFLTYTVAMVTPANKRPKMAKAWVALNQPKIYV
jgi:hypothetical protein